MDIQATARKVRYSVQAVALVVHTHESTLLLGSMVENLYKDSQSPQIDNLGFGVFVKHHFFET